MRLYKRGNKWYADLRREGLGRVATGAQEKAEARAIARRLVEGGAKGKTVADALTLALGTHYAGTKNWRNAEGIAKTLAAHLGEYKLDQMTGKIVSKYVAHCRKVGNSDATISRKLSMLTVAFRLAIAEGWMDYVPEKPMLAGSKVRHRELTKAEEYQLMVHSEEWASSLWYFLLDTGARVSEVLKLTEDDRVKALARQVVTFRDTKNGKDRAVPLTERATRLLWAWPWQGRSARQVSFAWEQARQKMGLRQDPGFVVHCLRHTCASRLLQGGVELPVVSKWLGHSSTKVTERYAHLRTEDLRSAVSVLES